MLRSSGAGRIASLRRHLPRFAVAVVGAGLLASGGASAGTKPPAKVTGWLSYGGDAQLTNQVPGVTGHPSFRRLWRTKLAGGMFASPLAALNVVVKGERRDAVFAATELGNVYAVDAASGKPLWKRSFGSYDTKVCGVYGISSTPVLDPRTGRLYVVGWDGLVRALDSASGRDVPGWKPLSVTLNSKIEHVWSGLRLVGDRLYVGVASYCDQRDEQNRPAEGRLYAIDTKRNRIASTLDLVPGPHNLGGIWGWGGVSVEPNGSFLYTTVGNACPKNDPATPGNCLDENAGHGNSIIRLTRRLEVVDSDAPRSVPSWSDSDFGATPVLFQPPGCEPLAAAFNKNRHLYIWRRHDLHAGAILDKVVSDDNGFFVGEPAYSSRLNMLYLTGVDTPGAGSGHGIAAMRVLPGCKFELAWKTPEGKPPYAPPIVVGDAVAFGTGTGRGFAVVDARTGKLLTRVKATQTTYAPLSAAGGRIFGDDYNGYLYAFAL